MDISITIDDNEYSLTNNHDVIKKQPLAAKISKTTAVVFELYTDSEVESSEWKALVALLARMTQLSHVVFVVEPGKPIPQISGVLMKKLVTLIPGRSINFLGFINCTRMLHIDNLTITLPKVKYLFVGRSNGAALTSAPYISHNDFGGLDYLGIIDTFELTYDTNYKQLIQQNALKKGLDFATFNMAEFDVLYQRLTQEFHLLDTVHFQYTDDSTGYLIEYDRTYDKGREALKVRTSDLAKIDALLALEGEKPTISFKKAQSFHYTKLMGMEDYERFKKTCAILKPSKIEITAIDKNAASTINNLWNGKENDDLLRPLLSITLSSKAANSQNMDDFISSSIGLRKKTWIAEIKSGLEYILPTKGDDVTFKTETITSQDVQTRYITALVENNPKILHIAQDDGTLIEEIASKFRPSDTQQMKNKTIWPKIEAFTLECEIKKVDVEFWFNSLKKLDLLIVIVEEAPEQQYILEMGKQIASCAIEGRKTKKTSEKTIIRCVRIGIDSAAAQSLSNEIDSAEHKSFFSELRQLFSRGSMSMKKLSKK